LFDIGSSLGAFDCQNLELKKRKIEKEVTTPDQVREVLLDVILDSNGVLSVPYGEAINFSSDIPVCAFRFAELLPDICKQKFPARVLNLIAVWGKPEETENRSQLTT